VAGREAGRDEEPGQDIGGEDKFFYGEDLVHGRAPGVEGWKCGWKCGVANGEKAVYCVFIQYRPRHRNC
jgi:hypothetical protein